MSRYAPSGVNYSFSPGAMTPAVRAIVFANVAVFIVTLFAAGPIFQTLGLTPADVIERGRIWQLATYLFVHGDLWHILFNMLAVWMFGIDLERRWGTRGFAVYYFVTGIGAGVCAVLVSMLPFTRTELEYVVPTIGASGAVYGLLMAWALIFPTRTILFALIFPLTARVYVIIMGAIAFFAEASAAGGTRVSNVAHLGGLVVGWLYLKGPRDLRLEFKYRLTKWRMDRMRRRFDVHKGGRIH